MKVLDPSSATLTLSEVHEFLQNKAAPTPTFKSGAYEPVDLRGYSTIKKEFELYLKRSAPHVPHLPPPAAFIPELLARLRERDIVLTKAEVLTLIDLGVGAKRPGATQTQSNGADTLQESVEMTNEDGTVVGADDRDDYTLLTAVVEEAESRFSDEQLNEVLAILREVMPMSSGRAQSLPMYGEGADATVEDGQVSVPVRSPSGEGDGDGVATQMAREAGVEDDAGEDDALLHEPAHQRSTGEGDIDGDE